MSRRVAGGITRLSFKKKEGNQDASVFAKRVHKFLNDLKVDRGTKVGLVEVVQTFGVSDNYLFRLHSESSLCSSVWLLTSQC